MKKVLLLLAILGSTLAQATHNRAGEITYRHVSGLTYEVRITTYTRSCSFCADRCELTINWGDSTSSDLPRVNGQNVRCPNTSDGVIIDPANQIRKNIYVGRHTYQATGAYTLYFEDPNRNAGINNIINSDLVPFYVQTELFISPSLGSNSSPVFTNPPVERGCLNKRFEHSPGAFDPDGDSLGFELVEVLTANGQSIPTIYDPQYVEDSVEVDANNGLFIWDAPRNVGQYNFAIRVSEYRRNGQGRMVRVGYVTRDFQVDIEDCGNNPPEIQPVGPFCVEAGQNLSFDVTATDPDGDPLTLTAFGGPYAVPAPADSIGVNGPEPLTTTFSWDTECQHVRKRPYQVSFKATDDPDDPADIPLSDIYTTEIRVIAPAPQNPQASADGSAIDLSWSPEVCTEATGYALYRREAAYGFIPDSCEEGVPAYTGYELLDSIPGRLDTTYRDTNGLEVGVQYCYMVIAYFPDGSESFASTEFCAALPLSLPLFTRVDVDATDPATGRINLAWIPPPILDSSLFPPPYEYRLFRASGIQGSNFTQIGTFPGLYDTTSVDQNLDTETQGYRYRLDFHYGPNQEKAGAASAASSVFLAPRSRDKAVQLLINDDTPWRNERYVVFRETPTGSGNFDSIATTFQARYRDTGLTNGENYCYRVTSYGRYTASDSLPAPLINRSQIACGLARDTIAPCTPKFSLRTVCPDTLYFSWEMPTDPSCPDDIDQFNIYFQPPGQDFDEAPLLQIQATGDSTIRFVNDGDKFGCFAITALDDADEDSSSTANESPLSEKACVENCFAIQFPNVFTPNGDGINDFFLPLSYNQVGEFHIEIYNRWGTRVYEANSLEAFVNPGWDGTVKATEQPAPDGVYYYLARYRAKTLDQSQLQQTKGFLHLMR